MGTVVGRSRLVVAQPNLRGFRGLTLDGFGALLQGGPQEMPAVFKRIFADQGKSPDPSAPDVWRRALHTLYVADPFVAFREVHRRAFQEMFQRFGLSGDVDACIEEAFEGYRRVRAYPEVSSVIEQLETEVALAVISNMDTRLLLEALQTNGLAFTFVITSEEEQRYKPSASIFQRAMRYLGLPAENILHVGDSYDEDVVGASSVGMGSMLMQRAAGSSHPTGTTGHVAHDLRDAREFVLRSWE